MSSNENLYRFTTAAGAAAAGVVLSTSLAVATGGGGEYGGEYGGEVGSHGFGDNAQIELTGYIEAECKFTTLPSGLIGIMQTDVPKDLGVLAFTCNMATSGPVTVTVKSANGALKRDGGSETVAYQIAWDIKAQ